MHAYAATAWLALLELHHLAYSRNERGDQPMLLAVATCAEIALLALSLVALIRILRFAREEEGSTGRVLACWGWTTAFVVAANQVSRISWLAAATGASMVVWEIEGWIRYIVKVPIPALVVVLVAFAVLPVLRGRSWPFRVLVAVIPILLLLWIWRVNYPPSI